ncbi:MAG: 3-deoxy-7-phosphoheptulonate synthase [Oscillospiraceae bacterium]|nr:3-deoxy-7-phosphoheptulonate synthase [Oscillospiraceae bacterium]
MSMEFHRRLPSPDEIKRDYPLSPAAAEVKARRDREIAEVFTGESDRFLLIIGPCSADYEESVMDYVNRLAKVQEQVKDKILIIPRIYTNKPRTTGDGYKGMVHQPDPNGKPDMLAGLLAIRNLHARVVTETGLTSADEMLYPENYQYLSDLLSYVAIGARSVEDQQHRLTSSGIHVPVGMKNPSCGDLSVMLNSIMAAQHAHTFIYQGWEVSTSGNPLAHAVLRGSIDNDGKCIPNYHYEDLYKLYEAYAAKGLENIACVVDTNHYNSNKKYAEQVRIAKEVLHSRRHSAEIRRMVKGLMIESYLEDGNQKIGEGCYGKSITDPCLGWEKSEKLIYDVADAL